MRLDDPSRCTSPVLQRQATSAHSYDTHKSHAGPPCTCGAGCCAAPRHVTHVSRLPSGQGPLWESFISSAPDSTYLDTTLAWRGALNASALTRARCYGRPQSNTHTYPSSSTYTHVRSHGQALSHGAGWLCGASPVACTRTQRRVRVGCGTSSTAPDSTCSMTFHGEAPWMPQPLACATTVLRQSVHHVDRPPTYLPTKVHAHVPMMDGTWWCVVELAQARVGVRRLTVSGTLPGTGPGPAMGPCFRQTLTRALQGP
jgi:hypothetical protein